MAKFELVIDSDALQDIQEVTNWYNMQSPGLGVRFQKRAITHINKLAQNPLSHSIRYATIRCSLIRKFPFLIHFTVDEEHAIVTIYAVIHTSRNPKIWEQKMKK